MKYSFTAFLLTCTILLSAQQFRYGFGIAPGRSWLLTEGDLYTSIGKTPDFSYGFLLDQTVGKGEHLAITLGFNLDYSQSGMNSVVTKPSDDEKEWYVRTEYFEVPLTLRLRTGQIGKFVFYAEGGASYAKGIRARGDYTLNGLRLDTDIDYLTKDNPNGISYLPTNANLIGGFGTEISITETASLLIGFTYQDGLMNVYSDNNDEYNIYLRQARIHIAGLF